jgi:hypothetical protein
MNNNQNPGVTIKSSNGSVIWQSPTMGLWQLISIDLKDILPSNKKLQAISISIDASGEKYAAVFGDAINGPFASNNPTIEPAILTMNEGETTWYSMHWTNADKTNTYGRERETIPHDRSCRFGIGATDATASVLTMTDDIIALDRAYEKINTLMTVANNYAQTYYNYLVVNGNEGLVPVYPDIVPIDPMMMQNMTATELYAIFIAYMMALEEGFNNGYSVNPGNVNVSLNSLNLICRGAVYNSTVHWF